MDKNAMNLKNCFTVSYTAFQPRYYGIIRKTSGSQWKIHRAIFGANWAMRYSDDGALDQIISPILCSPWFESGRWTNNL